MEKLLTGWAASWQRHSGDFCALWESGSHFLQASEGVGRLFVLSLMNSTQGKLAILPSQISGTHKETYISEKGCVSLRLERVLGGKAKFS